MEYKRPKKMGFETQLNLKQLRPMKIGTEAKTFRLTVRFQGNTIYIINGYFLKRENLPKTLYELEQFISYLDGRLLMKTDKDETRLKQIIENLDYPNMTIRKYVEIQGKIFKELDPQEEAELKSMTTK